MDKANAQKYYKKDRLEKSLEIKKYEKNESASNPPKIRVLVKISGSQKS